MLDITLVILTCRDLDFGLRPISDYIYSLDIPVVQ